MDQVTVDKIIQLGRAGKTQYGIATGLKLSQTVVSFVLNEDMRGTKAPKITEALNGYEKRAKK
jgi:hypothetical protein